MFVPFISRLAQSTSQQQLYSAGFCFRADPLGSSRMRLWMSDCSLTQHVLEYSLKWCTYSAVWLLPGWRHVKLLPSRRMFCVDHSFAVPLYWKSVRILPQRRLSKRSTETANTSLNPNLYYSNIKTHKVSHMTSPVKNDIANLCKNQGMRHRAF